MPTQAKYFFPPGIRFGKLEVIEDSLKGAALCKCDCGAVRNIPKAFLRRGQYKSCGQCVRGHPKHGMEGTAIYNAWAGMLQRCRNPKHKWYRRYGGRGIKVCDRWLEFGNFYEDMGEKPEGLSIDREDNDGDYEPGNCCWSSQKDQVRNRENTLMVEFEGRTVPVAELSERFGQRHKRVVARLKRGLSIKEALADARLNRWK